MSRTTHIKKRSYTFDISPTFRRQNSTFELFNPSAKTRFSSLVCPKSNHLLRYMQYILYRPELHAPPPLTPQGEIVQPVPEKSFLRKYWMYIVALLLIFCMSFMESSPSLNSTSFHPVLVGGDEEQPRRTQ